MEDLRWLGLDWEEGPDLGGAHAPYRQSERLELFQQALDRLIASGRAFPCVCSRADVARASQAPHGEEGPRYPGTCRARSFSGQRSYRLRVEPGDIGWTDLLHGARNDSVHDTVGDFVLKRADGIFAYQLAVVVDDAAMGITDVVRGDDLLSSTARQLLLYQALGLPAPRFLHVPLVLGPDGARLAKRHGSISVRTLRDQGVTAGRLIGALASTLGLCARGDTPTPSDLIRAFAVDSLPKIGSVIDPATLLAT